MGFSAASATNTYIPSLDGSGNLQVTFGRNRDRFTVPRVCTYTKVKHLTGFYKYINPDTAVRLIALADCKWPDGSPRPGQQTQNQIEFDNRPFSCERYNWNEYLGDLAREQNDFQLPSHITRQLGMLEMTAREKAHAAVWADPANYTEFGNTATATSLSGASWYTSSLDNAYIQRGLQAAAAQILKNCVGRVEYLDLYILMNPTTAAKLGTAPEVKQATIQQSGSQQIVQGKTWNREFGLPNELFGFTVAVDKSIYIPSRKTALQTGQGQLAVIGRHVSGGALIPVGGQIGPS